MLEIKGLNIAYHQTPTVMDVNITVKEKEIVGIVGESGSGKTTILRSIIGLLGTGGKVTGGAIRFQDRDLMGLSEEEFRKLRGRDIAIIFQHPETYLDPLMTIGSQFFQAMRVHGKISKLDALEKAKKLLRDLSFENPERVLDSYLFELSGGMCQRAAATIAMANHPGLLLTDEPTSALDVTVQLQMVKTLLAMRDQYGTAIVLATHNMGIVAKMADTIGVMYCGCLVEWGPKAEVLSAPAHPYTQALIRAIPKMDGSIPVGLDPLPNDIRRPKTGCAFSPHCGKATAFCYTESLKKQHISPDHWILCCC